MAKQTMGVPLLSWRHRNDNKMYSLTTPQSPLVRPGLYDVLEADEYPLGTNACIAVMSYTVSFMHWFSFGILLAISLTFHHI